MRAGQNNVTPPLAEAEGDLARAHGPRAQAAATQARAPTADSGRVAAPPARQTARSRLEPEQELWPVPQPEQEREAERFQHLRRDGFQLLLGPGTSGVDVTFLFSVIDA